MQVDDTGVVALLIAGSIVTTARAALLIAAARAMREAPLAWWAAALITRAIAGVALAAGFARALPPAGAALMPLGSTAVWAGNADVLQTKRPIEHCTARSRRAGIELSGRRSICFRNDRKASPRLTNYARLSATRQREATGIGGYPDGSAIHSLAKSKLNEIRGVRSRA
jgi:hypothetical protein